MSNDTNLSHENESFIQQQVSLGLYRDRNEALDRSVELLRCRDSIITRLAESRRQLDDGEYLEFDDVELHHFFDGLKSRARNRVNNQ